MQPQGHPDIGQYRMSQGAGRVLMGAAPVYTGQPLIACNSTQPLPTRVQGVNVLSQMQPLRVIR